MGPMTSRDSGGLDLAALAERARGLVTRATARTRCVVAAPSWASPARREPARPRSSNGCWPSSPSTHRAGLAGGDWVAHVPMDGFHLADAQLDRLGLRERKGAPETFDAAGYAAVLERARTET